MMKITNMEVIPVEMKNNDPEWRYALSVKGVRHGQFLTKLTTEEGFIGLGLASAGTHGASYGGVKSALETYAQVLIGEEIFNMEKIFCNLNRMLSGNNGAKAAIDIALHDLQAKALGVPLHDLLGGLVREEIPVIRIMALKEPAQNAVIAANLVEQGYSYLKIKLDGNQAKDLERVKETRKAVGADVHLTVDANQQYSPKLAIDTLKRMYDYGVELCEQPVRADDWEGLAAVTRSVDCMVEAHESAQSVEQIFGLVKDRVVDSINIKIPQIGGLRNAKIAAAMCKLGNVACRVGTVGSRLQSAASMHFVAATENISYACELGEFSRLLNDPAEGLEVVGGMLKVPSGPGLGVSLLG